MEPDRLIQLRRPPVVSVAAEPWVPEGIDPVQVESCWQSIMDANPKAFDGRVLHVLGVHRNGTGGVSLHVAECAYRYYAVQVSGLDCGVRALGAKAITRSGDRMLLGLRADWVMYYPGQWEFVPGGSVQPGQEPVETILEELQEETHCQVEHPPIPVAIAYDPHAFAWEIIHHIQLPPTASPVGSMEYDQLRWCEPDTLPEPMTPIAQRMATLVEAGPGVS